jgi:cytochrome bd ubiquinol oxidase subunit I
MGDVLLARWQFGITSVYHFLFVPLTLGLSVLIAVMETLYVKTGNELYKKMTKFWGKLFLINFALGVVTGLVQEFQFGMNWSEYSRFMGDIFGVPLALEALTAFYLESVFIGLWLFGWDRVSAKVHLAFIWLVAFASNLSALWILVANSFMQAPVGYVLRNGRAEMTDFLAVLTNPYVLGQYPHTLMGGLTTAGIFIMSISAYHLLRKNQPDFFRTSFRIGLICTLGAMLLVMGTGHLQAQQVAKSQPMKLAVMESLWETAKPAPYLLFASIDQEKQKNTMEIGVPGALSLLVYGRLDGEIKGIKELQTQYVQKYGQGNYIPDIFPVFWSYRVMIAAGLWMLLLSLYLCYLFRTNRLETTPWALRAALWSLPGPYLANSAGWTVTEMGRQPWIVFGLQRVEQAVSPTVTSGEVWTSLIGFTLLYGVLAVVGVHLLTKFARMGPVETESAATSSTGKEATLWN